MLLKTMALAAALMMVVPSITQAREFPAQCTYTNTTLDMVWEYLEEGYTLYIEKDIYVESCATVLVADEIFLTKDTVELYSTDTLIPFMYVAEHSPSLIKTIDPVVDQDYVK